jgi:kynurenine formamidase
MILDVSMIIKSGSVFRRGTPPVQIESRKFYHEEEGAYVSIIIQVPAHTATHVDLVLPGRRMEPDRMIGNGKLIDVTWVESGEITLAHVRDRVDLEAGDFAFFRTDWSQFADTARYHDHPELSLELVQWLADRRVNAVGIDALGLARGRGHGEHDRLLARQDVYVIENLANLAAIPARPFRVYCLPLKMDDTDAIPARVLVEVEGQRTGSDILG